MDILYIINKQLSYCNNAELRWSLRSLEQYGKNIGRIFMVGDIPDFVSDEVVKLQHADKFTSPKNKVEKHANITDHVLYAISNSDISDDFLASMDDHYLLKEVDFDEYPTFVKDYDYGSGAGFLPSIEDEKKGDYHRGLVFTAGILAQNNLPTINFIMHRNMKCNRHIWNECADKFPEFTEGVEPFAFTLNYAHSQKPFEFVLSKDVKAKTKNFQKNVIENDTEAFSSYDMVNYCGMYKWMEELFPHKSKYEI